MSCVFDSLCLPTYYWRFSLYVLLFGLAWILIKTLLSSSWGPDDDGNTVDGPHPLGKVRESQAWQFVLGTVFVLQGAVHCSGSVKEQHACRNTGTTVSSLGWLVLCFLHRRHCSTGWLQADEALAASLWLPVATEVITMTTATMTAMPTPFTPSLSVRHTDYQVFKCLPL